MSNGKNRRIIIGIILIVVLLALVVVLINNHTELSSWLLGEQYPEISQEEICTPNVDGVLILTMIDCGQGDSFLFSQNGKTALVDCGTRSSGKDVVKYLKENGISHLDYVFGTHPHDDHMGGMYEVITNFDIGLIIIPKIEEGKVLTNWYLQLTNEIAIGGYNYQYAEVGNEYTLGDAVIRVIGQMQEPNNLNNYSTVMKVSFGNMDIIMTGDAEKSVENEILQSVEILDAEILKLGHHGSDTSTSDEFLDAISPQYALISCAIGNKYNHPTVETMEKLKIRGVKVYRTDESGTVILTITATSIQFSCEPGDYLSGTELKERSTK